MAVDAIEHVTTFLYREHVVDKLFVALEAGSLCYCPVAGLYAQGVRITSRREGKGVEETVVSFSDPFPNWMRAEVAVVAGGSCMVTGLLPGVEMVLHDVAICTGGWVVAEI